MAAGLALRRFSDAIGEFGGTVGVRQTERSRQVATPDGFYPESLSRRGGLDDSVPRRTDSNPSDTASDLMARDHARLRHKIWADEHFTALPEAAQRAYMMALSQPGLNYCGVVPYTVKRWANLAADSTVSRLSRAFQTLQEARFVVIDEDSEELLFRTFIKHDGILESPNICKASAKAYPTVVSRLLRGVFLVELHRLHQGSQEKGWEKGWPEFADLLAEPLPQGLPEGFHQRFCEDFGESRAGACPCPSPDPSPSPGGCDHDLRDCLRPDLCKFHREQAAS